MALAGLDRLIPNSAPRLPGFFARNSRRCSRSENRPWSAELHPGATRPGFPVDASVGDRPSPRSADSTGWIPVNSPPSSSSGGGSGTSPTGSVTPPRSCGHGPGRRAESAARSGIGHLSSCPDRILLGAVDYSTARCESSTDLLMPPALEALQPEMDLLGQIGEAIHFTPGAEEMFGRQFLRSAACFLPGGW